MERGRLGLARSSVYRQGAVREVKASRGRRGKAWMGKALCGVAVWGRRGDARHVEVGRFEAMQVSARQEWLGSSRNCEEWLGRARQDWNGVARKCREWLGRARLAR